MARMNKDKLPGKEETKQESITEQTVIDEKLTIMPNGEETAEVIIPMEEAVIEKVKEENSAWKPITELGRKVKGGDIKDINFIFDKGLRIKESQIVDMLLDNVEADLLLIGQSKGKFGGGSRKAFKQTQKKTCEGNKPKFATFSVIGNKNGFVGIGYGKAKETVPAREKSLRTAKINLMRIRRGCGSWQCGCKMPHSIPFQVEGKVGSCKIILKPAPKGTGLKIEKECQRILGLAGIKDVWARAFGQTGSKINLVKACEAALKKLSSTKVQDKFNKDLGITDGDKARD